MGGGVAMPPGRPGLAMERCLYAGLAPLSTSFPACRPRPRRRCRRKGRLAAGECRLRITLFSLQVCDRLVRRDQRALELRRALLRAVRVLLRAQVCAEVWAEV